MAGRKRNLIPTTNLDVNVPTHVVKQVQDRFYDPRTGKPQYGALGRLVTELLEEWLKRNPLNPHIQKLKEEEVVDAARNL